MVPRTGSDCPVNRADHHLVPRCDLGVQSRTNQRNAAQPISASLKAERGTIKGRDRDTSEMIKPGAPPGPFRGSPTVERGNTINQEVACEAPLRRHLQSWPQGKGREALTAPGPVSARNPSRRVSNAPHQCTVLVVYFDLFTDQRITEAQPVAQKEPGYRIGLVSCLIQRLQRCAFLVSNDFRPTPDMEIVSLHVTLPSAPSCCLAPQALSHRQADWDLNGDFRPCRLLLAEQPWAAPPQGDFVQVLPAAREFDTPDRPLARAPLPVA